MEATSPSASDHSAKPNINRTKRCSEGSEKACFKTLYRKEKKYEGGGEHTQRSIAFLHTRSAPALSRVLKSRALRCSQSPVTFVHCLENARVAPPQHCQTWLAVRGGGGIIGGGCRRFPSSWAGGRRGWGVSTPRRRAPTGACCRGPRGWSPACGWCPQCRCSPPSGQRSARTPAAGGRSPSPASPGSRPRRA